MSNVLLDTNVVSFLFKGHSLAQVYRPHLQGKTLAISFMTLAEVLEGAYRASWGAPKLARLEALFAATWSSPPLETSASTGPRSGQSVVSGRSLPTTLGSRPVPGPTAGRW